MLELKFLSRACKGYDLFLLFLDSFFFLGYESVKSVKVKESVKKQTENVR